MRVAIGGVLFASALGMASAANAAVTVTGTFDGTEATMDGRLFRNATASTCSPTKAYPGISGAGSARAYRTDTVYNNGPAQCVTVAFDVGTCGTNVHLVAYAGSFNPADLSQNYIGDVGSSSSQSFSFTAPADSAIVIMAQDNNGVAARCTYSFTSTELFPTPVLSPTAIPTLSQWGMIIMSAMLGLAAFGAIRRNDRS